MYNAKIGEIIVAGEDAKIKCIVGSCVAVVMYDKHKKIGGIAHILLPSSKDIDDCKENDYRFADIAIPRLFNLMLKNGATRKNIIAYIYGGALMFDYYKSRMLAEIGEKNIEAVEKELKKLGVPFYIKDIGKDYGRRIELNVATGEIKLKIYRRLPSVPEQDRGETHSD